MKTKLIKTICVVAALLMIATACGCNPTATSSQSSSQTAVSSQPQSSSEAVSYETISQLISSVSGVSSAESESTSNATSVQPISSSSVISASLRPGIADLVERIADSVVAINVTGVTYDYFNREYPTEGSGSGVIISADGYIVTNNHVVTGGTTITVFLQNGSSYPAELIGTSGENDIALLKINATGLSAAKVGNSSTLRVGDSALAIGNPLGELQGTVTTGIISGLEREITIDDRKFTVLQTDAAVNPGNSGGGLFDYNGELIGIVVAKNSESNVEGLGFVLPIDSVMPVVAQLAEYGYVPGRAYIGLTIVDIASTLAARMNGVDYIGPYVQSVEAGSPAEAAGLKSADFIVSVDGVSVSDGSQVISAISGKNIGDTITFTVIRDREQITITVTVSEDKT